MTTEPKYTPGEWRAVLVRKDGDPVAVWQIVGEETDVAATLVCTLPHYSKDNDGNAALIASAPSILADNERLREALQAMLHARVVRADDVIEQARAALSATERTDKP